MKGNKQGGSVGIGGMPTTEDGKRGLRAFGEAIRRAFGGGAPSAPAPAPSPARTRAVAPEAPVHAAVPGAPAPRAATKPRPPRAQMTWASYVQHMTNEQVQVAAAIARSGGRLTQSKLLARVTGLDPKALPGILGGIKKNAPKGTKNFVTASGRGPKRVYTWRGGALMPGA